MHTFSCFLSIVTILTIWMWSQGYSQLCKPQKCKNKFYKDPRLRLDKDWHYYSVFPKVKILTLFLADMHFNSISSLQGCFHPCSFCWSWLTPKWFIWQLQSYSRFGHMSILSIWPKKIQNFNCLWIVQVVMNWLFMQDEIGLKYIFFAITLTHSQPARHIYLISFVSKMLIS